MRSTLQLSIAAGMLLLSACAINRYEAPTVGSTARLRVVSPTQFVEVLVLPGDGSHCITSNPEDVRWLAMLSTGIVREGLQGKSIGMPGGAGIVSTSLQESSVLANAPLSLRFLASGYKYTCLVDMAFTPKPGADYEASFSGDNRQCRVTVSEIKVGADGSINRADVPVSKLDQCKHTGIGLDF